MRQALFAHLAFAAGLAAADPSFQKDVLPLLQRNCAGCHQPGGKASDLDVTTYAALKAGGKRGPALASASGDALLVQYLTGAMKPVMPLGRPPLPDEEIAVFRDWIKAGAKDDSGRQAGIERADGLSSTARNYGAAFSPDGKWIAVSGNREVLVHAADGSGLKARLQGKAERLLSIAFSKDSKMLVAAGGTPARFGEVQWWDLATAKQLRAAELTNDTVFARRWRRMDRR